MGTRWIRDQVAKFEHMSYKINKHVLELEMTSLVLYNVMCHALKDARLRGLNCIDVVLDNSNIIEESTLTRSYMKLTEAAAKDQIINKYIHNIQSSVILSKRRNWKYYTY